MSRWIPLTLVLVCLSPQARAEDDPLKEVLAAIDQSLGTVEKLAFIRPEATGTTEDLSGLQSAITDHLSAREKTTVIPPEEVFKKAGPEFEVTADGVAGVAKKMEAQAALFVRMFKSPEQTDLHVLLVDAEAKVLLDKSFPMAVVPPEPEPTQPTQHTETAETEPPPEPQEAPPGDSALEAFERRRLALVPRTRIVGGASVGLVGRHVAVGIHTPPIVSGDWMIVRGEQPISELELAKLSGRDDIHKRMQDDIGTLKTWRNLGIGLTLGGFITAGVASPFFKAEGDEAITAAGVFVGVGVAAGVAGLVLWLIYGPDASMAETPYPSRHLITKEEAIEMVEGHNDSLRRELDLQPPVKPASPPKASVDLSFYPMPEGGAAALTIRF